jgi:hypothetical protein
MGPAAAIEEASEGMAVVYQARRIETWHSAASSFETRPVLGLPLRVGVEH